MATIATTTNTAPFIYPANTLLDRSPGEFGGYLFTVVKASAANTYEFYRSTNGGASWSLVSTVTRASIQEIGSIFVDNVNWLHWCYRTNESSQDRIYYRRMRLDTFAWDAEVLTGRPDNGGVAGAVHTGLDLMIVVVPYMDYAVYVALACGTTYGGVAGVTLYGVLVSGGVGQYNNGIFSGTRQWLPETASAGVHITPSLDLQHTGDGKSAGTPHLWCVWGRARLLLAKLSWNGAGWSGPSSPVTMVTTITATNGISGRYDGVRTLIALRNPSGTGDTVAVYERNAANTSTTTRASPAHPAGIVRCCSVTYDVGTGNFRVFAVGTSTSVLYYIDYTRQSGVWGSWVSTTITVMGTNADNWGLRRSAAGNARYDFYTAVAGTPNTLSHTAQVLSYSPQTPTWTSPPGGTAQNVSAGLTLDWQFNDVDPADTQSAYAVSRQIGAGSLSYWRASDSSWQTTEQQNSSATTALTLASGWGADGDANHTYKVKVWDSASLASGYSTGLVIIPATKSEPSITAPTVDQVIAVDEVTVTWTVTEQTAYRLVLISGGVTYFDSGKVIGSATSVTPPLSLGNGTSWQIQLTTWENEGLASTTQTRNFSVSFTPPATPTLVVADLPAMGVIRVAITNPAPSGGQPTVIGQDLYRRAVGESGTGIRIAVDLAGTGAIYDDWQAASGVAYEYRSFVRGSTGATVYSAWTA